MSKGDATQRAAGRLGILTRFEESSGRRIGSAGPVIPLYGKLIRHRTDGVRHHLHLRPIGQRNGARRSGAIGFSTRDKQPAMNDGFEYKSRGFLPGFYSHG
jgi:hypothetical protein